ncbi:MAG: LamG-like jellyroll fold domain-containing protein, partial [Alphaproteobacteria bacterium]
ASFMGTMDDTNWNPTGGVFGGSIVFTDVDGEALNTGFTSVNTDQAFTYTGWIKTPGGTYGTVMGQEWDTSAGILSPKIEIRNDYLRLHPGSDSFDNEYFDSANVITAGQWHHFALVYEGPTTHNAYIYINGALSASDTSGTWNPWNDTNPGHNLVFGGQLNNGVADTASDIELDEVRIYSRALGIAEVQQLYELSENYICAGNRDAGKIIFNQDVAAMQYCDGSAWQSMGKEASVLHGEKTRGQDYSINAVNFDGTNDYLTSGGALTGVTDTKLWTGSLWFRRNASATTELLMEGSDLAFRIQIEPTDDLLIGAENSAGTEILYQNNNSLINDTNWHHLMFSFDMSDINRRHLYIDGVLDIQSPGIFIDDFIYASVPETSIGGGPTGALKFLGEVADVWIDFGTYIDLSIESNRRKFITADGGPVYLGTDGSLPTGSQPDIFLYGSTSRWHQNKGPGGGFTEHGDLIRGDNFIVQELHYKLDETSGTIAFDSLSDLDGIMEGGLDATNDSVAGQVGTAINFDGVDDFISYPFVGLKNATISGWVNADVTSQDAWIINHYESNADGWGIKFVNGEILLYNDIDGVDVTMYSTAVTTGQWHHFAAVLDDLENKLYINGTLVGSGTTASSSLASYNGGFYLGQRGNSSFFFDGSLDDIRVDSRALSDQEISNLYNNISNGLVGHWRLDETSGTTAADSSDFGNDGTMQGSMDGASDTGPGAIGTSLSFDGVDDYIRLPNSDILKPALPVTLSVWIHPNDLSSLQTVLMTDDWADEGSNYYGIAMQIGSNGTVSASFGDGTGSLDNDRRTKVSNTGLINVGQWHHVVAVIQDSSNMDLYVNGVSAGGSFSGTASSLAYQATSQPKLSSINSQIFNGRLDDVRMYNRVLSAAEIGDLYELGARIGIDNGLVGYWKLDETSGTTAADSSGNGLDGNMLGGLDASSANVAGIINTALEFDGNNNEIEIADSAIHEPSFVTISAWAKPTATGDHDIVSKRQTVVDNNHGYRLRINSPEDTFSCEFGFNTGTRDVGVSTANFNLDQWYHVACTDNGNEARIYVDGVLVDQDTSGAGNNISYTSVVGLRIGIAADGGKEFAGPIDDVRIYNRVLSPAEIEVLAACTGPGAQYYNFSNDAMQWCDGVASPRNMAPPASGSGGCTGGSEGSMRYQTDRYQFCDGNGWVDIGK